jgi:hypothetical protein
MQERYEEVITAGLPVASRLFLHSHSKIKAGFRQSSLTPTYVYRPRTHLARFTLASDALDVLQRVLKSE